MGALFSPLQWNDMGLVTNAGAGSPALSSVTKTAWNIFNTENFNISPQSIPLPVELIDFSANCKDNKVVIHWTSATETNNDYFTLEKSFDGKTFEAVSTLKGSGTTTEIHEYQATDEISLQTVYYRLKQTDYDGASSNSDIILINCRHDGKY